MQNQTPTDIKPLNTTSNSTPIRIHKTTARTLRNLITKINKLPHGKRIKVDQIIAAALNLLTEEDLRKIKEATYSSEDRLKIEHKKFCDSHGNISREEFLQKILSNFTTE